MSFACLFAEIYAFDLFDSQLNWIVFVNESQIKRERKAPSQEAPFERRLNSKRAFISFFVAFAFRNATFKSKARRNEIEVRCFVRCSFVCLLECSTQCRFATVDRNSPVEEVEVGGWRSAWLCRLVAVGIAVSKAPSTRASCRLLRNCVSCRRAAWARSCCATQAQQPPVALISRSPRTKARESTSLALITRRVITADKPRTDEERAKRSRTARNREDFAHLCNLVALATRPLFARLDFNLFRVAFQLSKHFLSQAKLFRQTANYGRKQRTTQRRNAKIVSFVQSTFRVLRSQASRVGNVFARLFAFLLPAKLSSLRRLLFVCFVNLWRANLNSQAKVRKLVA